MEIWKEHNFRTFEGIEVSLLQLKFFFLRSLLDWSKIFFFFFFFLNKYIREKVRPLEMLIVLFWSSLIFVTLGLKLLYIALIYLGFALFFLTIKFITCGGFRVRICGFWV